MRKPSTEPVDDPVVARIVGLLEEQKKTQKQLVEYLGLANGGSQNGGITAENSI